MRIGKLFCVLLATLLCLLLSASAWASLPQPGIYEKTDDSGRLTARMFVISLKGKTCAVPGAGSIRTFSGSPLIVLQAFDEEGIVTEELATSYTWKTDYLGRECFHRQRKPGKSYTESPRGPLVLSVKQTGNDSQNGVYLHAAQEHVQGEDKLQDTGFGIVIAHGADFPKGRAHIGQ